MARSRNIKPGFFTNEDLAENDPLGRLLFAGLWTIADYRGNIEWRPKRIKAQILPYDDCDIHRLTINLDKSGFVRFYSDGEKIYLHICNFAEHQNPHKNEREKGSDIPEYTETMRQAVDLKGLTIIPDKIAINPDKNGTAPADSLKLIPDSINPIPEIVTPPADVDRIPYQAIADLFNKHFEGLGPKAKLTPNDKRKKSIKAMWNMDTKNKDERQRTNQLDFWDRYFEYLAGTGHVTRAANGEITGKYSGWRPNLEWAMRESTLTKAREGAYD